MPAARFAGKSAIVTGGGSGIGRAVAQALAAEGAAVTIGDISKEMGEETVALIAKAGGTVRLALGDVTKAGDAQRIVSECVRAYSKVNVLCNVAGGSKPKDTVVELPEEEWRFLLEWNLTSVFLMCKYAIPEMRKAGGGAIVSVSSGAGVSGMPRNPGYVAAKGGVIALTKALAIDHAGENIRANCVAPGAVLTPLMRRNRTPEEIKTLGSYNLLKRLGRAEELAQAVIYLASDEASFITGQTINVDGGANR